MNRHIVIAVLLICVPIVIAQTAGWGGYSGYSGTERRLNDPYTRYSYFGENYTKSLVNYGSKGPVYTQTTTGAKSAYSGVFNLDTNAYYARARDPSRISNWDPNVRGFSQLDATVTLLPYDVVGYEENEVPRGPRGTAKVLSRGDAYGAGLNTRLARSQVFVQTIDLPPIPSYEAYEVWLVDEESGYSLSVGLLKTGGKFTAQLSHAMSRSLAGFDAVMVTREQYPDIDPTPGEVVLFGYMEQSRAVVNSLGADAGAWLR